MNSRIESGYKFKNMGTFLEILFTSVLTFGAGMLCMKYKPKSRKKAVIRKTVTLKNQTAVSRDYSAKFIVIFLFGALFFTGVLYLTGNGIIVLKW